MPGIDYDSVINVHICHNGVPGRASGCVSGMSAAYENQALEVCKQENITEAEWFRVLVLLRLFEIFVSFVSVACL